MPNDAYRTPVLAASLGILLFLSAGSATIAAPSAASMPAPGAERYRAAGKERQKILATLESRLRDEKALEKMRGKVEALAGRKLRLAAALCDRIEGDGDSAGADIAFSLVTALIVLA